MKEPRHRDEYGGRQGEACLRVLVDLGQVLAAFTDCVVVVGGSVPGLLLRDAEEPHVGSIDVDLALDAARLGDGRYAELIQLVLETRRYRQSTKSFQLVASVDLDDGEMPVEVEVDFLAPTGVKLTRNRPKLLPEFRVLQAEGCASAFRAPQAIELSGRMIGGASNTVVVRVASLADFLVMKAHALAGRDKPKDGYDICYCLDNFPGGLGTLAAGWRSRQGEPEVVQAIQILRQKFASVESFGPRQVVEFQHAVDPGVRDMHARRAFELVQRLLGLL